MFLLINDRCVIRYVCKDKPKLITTGWMISPQIIIRDTQLELIEINDGNIPSDLIPNKYLYRDKTFQINPDFKEVIDPEIKISHMEKNIENLQNQLKGEDPNNLPLDKYKLYMKEKNNDLLSEFLKSHPLLWTNGKYYGVTEEDQNQLLGNYNGWKMDQALGIDSKLEWNATNEACTEWSEPELLMLISAIYKYAKKMVKLCQYYKVQIVNATTKDEVNTIDLVYTEELADEIMKKIG